MPYGQRLAPPRLIVRDALSLASIVRGGSGPVQEVLVLPRTERVARHELTCIPELRIDHIRGAAATHDYRDHDDHRDEQQPDAQHARSNNAFVSGRHLRVRVDVRLAQVSPRSVLADQRPRTAAS